MANSLLKKSGGGNENIMIQSTPSISKSKGPVLFVRYNRFDVLGKNFHFDISWYFVISEFDKEGVDCNYIQHGFTFMLKNGRELLQCVVCFKVLHDQSMKPSLLKRHNSGCHPELVNKDSAFFKRMEIGVKRVRLDKSGQVNQINQASLRTSYMVALRIAQELHIQSLRSSYYHVYKDIVRYLFEYDGKKKISYVPLSNYTVHRRICDIPEDIEQQVVTKYMVHL